jgi:hypothetical protein
MQDTNLRISPYFDDFDRSKNYQKVLFKPGYSVQTRELNSLQSIIQNQIERFGQHVFKDGSVVIPGNINYNLSLKAVMIQSLINGVSVETYRKNLVGKTLTGTVSGVKAEVVDTISQTESEKDTITLYVKYTGGGIIEDNSQVSEFKNNEILYDENNVAVAITTVQNSTAYTASSATINAGVYFIRGFFVEVPTQRIILDQYGDRPSYKVGLQVSESIIDSEGDASLFDNALGSTNYASPGADRLKIEAKLVKQNLLITEDSNFIELLRMEKGKVTLIRENSIYNELEKNLARRTYDESGSYTIKPYSIRIREALNDGENDGVYFPNEVLPSGETIVSTVSSNSPLNSINGKDYYAVEVSEGKAYVKGFEVTNERKQFAIVPKPRKYNQINNQGIPLNIGSHFKLDGTQTIRGRVQFNDTIYLKDVDGVIIGSCKSIGLTAGFRLYVTDVSVFETLTLLGTTNISIGDYVTGSTSGASAFVDSVVGQDIKLKQVTGTFISGESVVGSRFSGSTPPTISSISRNLLENVRTVEKIVNGSSEFLATVSLDSISLTGSLFTVAGGTTLTGINTLFNFELSAKSKVRIGESIVEVDTVQINGSSVTLSSSISNGTYYAAAKLICKLYKSQTGLTVRASNYPVKSGSDFIHNRLVSDIGVYTINSNGGFTIAKASSEAIDVNSIVVTTSSTRVSSATYNQTSPNIVEVSGTGLTAGTSVNVYYNSRISNPSSRTKELQKYKALTVDKQLNSTNNVYGTRYSDREISLKFADVTRVHCVHQAVRVEDSPTDMFDYLVLNNSANIVAGDLITSGLIRARVVGVAAANKVYIKYISSSKFPSATNIALSVDVPTNPAVSGVFIRESAYGRYIDVTNDFIFVRNDSEDIYKISKLVRRSSAAVPNNKLVVMFDHFEHDNLSNDFYSVQSYGDLDYEDIPLSYNFISLGDLIDFRYYTQPSSVGSSTGQISSPYTETSTTSPFNLDSASFLSATTQKVPYPSSVFGLDYEFYLGRVDKVYLTIDGNVRVVKGSDSVEPQATTDESVGLLLGTIKLPPYLKNVLDVQLTIEKTRNYTMRDIGKLEDRLSNVEKYTSLSLLEVNTNNLNILDEEGRNRFKNGFVVDSFSTTDVADLQNPDYTASIDLDKNIVRPYPYVNNISFNYNASQSGLVKKESYLTLPYTEVSYASQLYCSRVEPVTPFEVFSWIGEMNILPKKDIWYDTVREYREGQNINLVDAYTTLFDLVVPTGQIWGGWQLGAGGARRGGGGTTITDIRQGTQYEVGSLNFDIETGDTIQNIQDVRFTRSRIVDITTTNLKPNTKFYFAIDDQSSNGIAYPKLFRNLTNTVGKFVLGETILIQPIYDDNVLRPQVVEGIRATVEDPRTFVAPVSTTDFDTNGYTTTTKILAFDNVRSLDGTDINPGLIGSRFTIIGESSGARTQYTSSSHQDLITNQLGTLEAFVLIPEQTFETGDLTFSLSDDENNIQVKGLTKSYATGTYYSQGTELNVSTTIVSIDVPEVTATSITESRNRFIPDPPPPPPFNGGGDPLAQSFFIEEEGGIFATSLDLFFLTKDSEVPVSIEIRTVENGSPTKTVVPGSVVTVPSSLVNVSTDSTVPTRFTFNRPVYLSDKNEYAFVVKSFSQKYFVWVSRLGETDTATGFVIDKQPNVGVLFKSANLSTWISDQYEDIKFVLNRAQFTPNQTFTAVLNNKSIPSARLSNNPIYFSENSSVVKIFQPNHGMHVTQSRVKLDNIVSDTSNARLAAGISTTNQSIQILDVTGASFDASTIEGWSKINNLPISSINPGYIKIDDEIISYTGITNNTLTNCVRGALSTTARAHSTGAIVQCFQLNGIPLSQLNTTHSITKVISLDEYEITVANRANSTKQSGGLSVFASRNIQYEIIQPNLNIFVPSECQSTVSFTSVTGTSIGNTVQQSFITKPSQSLENGVENIMTEPRLVLSEPNRSTYQNSAEGTLNTIVSFSTSTDRLSPILDLDGTSAITISNRLNKELDNQGNLDLSSELLPKGGKHSSYITKKVVLETAATSVKVLFDAIRNPSNEIKVFIKIKGDSNPSSFDDMNYVEIPAVSYPVSSTSTQFRAFDYEIKSLREFKEFSVKVVLIGNDQSSVPFVRNFRSIALAI